MSSPPLFDINNNGVPVKVYSIDRDNSDANDCPFTPSVFLTSHPNRPDTLDIDDVTKPGSVTPSDSGYQSLRIGVSFSSNEASPPFSAIDQNR